MKKEFFLYLGFAIFFSLLIGGIAVAKDQGEIEHQIELLKSDDSTDRQRAILKLLNTMDSRVIGTLIQTLRDPDPYVRYTVAWALNPRHMNLIEGNYSAGVLPLKPAQSAEVVAALLDALPDNDFWVREAILEALENLHAYQIAQGVELDKRTKQLLIVHIKDQDPYIRSSATEALSFWKDDPDVKKSLLTALVEDEYWGVRIAALDNFKQDLDVLAEALRDRYFEVRIKAVRIIQKYHKENPRSVDLLVERLGDPAPSVVGESIHVLGLTKSPRAIKPLLEYLSTNEDRDHLDVRGAIKTITGKSLEEVKKDYKLGLKNSPSKTASIKKLIPQNIIKKLEEGTRNEKISASTSTEFYWVEHKEGVEILLKSIQDQDPRVRYAFMSVLTYHIGHPVISSTSLESLFNGVVKATKDPHPHVRRKAIEALGQFLSYVPYQSRVIDLIKKVVDEEKDPFIRYAGISYARSFYIKDAGPIFLKLLKDEFHEIRRAAVYAVSLRCSPEAVDQIIEALWDPFSMIRLYAAQDLGLGRFIRRVNYMKVQSALRGIAENDPSDIVRSMAKQSFDSNQRYFEHPDLVPDKQPSTECAG